MNTCFIIHVKTKFIKLINAMADETIMNEEQTTQAQPNNCECDVCNCEVVGDKCPCTIAAENARWGEIGHEIPGKFYQVYHNGRVLFDDEGIYDSFRANSEKISSISVKTIVSGDETAITYPNYEWNKYGKTIYMDTVAVKITPNADLAAACPLANVTINGKCFDLAYLDKEFNLVMDKVYRISIHWSENMVESFGIVPAV